MRTNPFAMALIATLLLAIPAAASAANCSRKNRNKCADAGGVADKRDGTCYCDFYGQVPRRVANAEDGDVAIIGIDGRGSEIVTLVTREIGQFHRHNVMFYNDGRRTRHSTMYVFDGDDGDASDGSGDYVRLYSPLIGKVRFDGDDLQNGLPGALSQTVQNTYKSGRLGDAGLVLKPALRMRFTQFGTVYDEPNRDEFEAAVAEARTVSGYYKLGDYSDMDSMTSRPYNANRQGDLRGSHCSGYATHFYRRQGLDLPDVFYPESLREDAADALYDAVLHQCRTGTNFGQDLAAFFTLHWSNCRNIANQIVNCFANLSCGDTTNTWRNAVGSGTAVSPDNLLPESFRYGGIASYQWDGVTLTSGSSSGGGFSTLTVGGRSVDHPGLSGPEPHTSANDTSPFQRVEAIRYSGAYYTVYLTVKAKDL